MANHLLQVGLAGLDHILVPPLSGGHGAAHRLARKAADQPLLSSCQTTGMCWCTLVEQLIVQGCRHTDQGSGSTR